jgi:hypothetical protein
MITMILSLNFRNDMTIPQSSKIKSSSSAMTKELQLVAFVKLPVPGKWKFHLQLTPADSRYQASTLHMMTDTSVTLRIAWSAFRQVDMPSLNENWG